MEKESISADNAISEAVSENKRRRGRPTVFERDHMEDFDRLITGAYREKTRRTIVAHYYRSAVFGILEDHNDIVLIRTNMSNINIQAHFKKYPMRENTHIRQRFKKYKNIISINNKLDYIVQVEECMLGMSFSDMDKDAKALESDEENKNISHETIKYNGKNFVQYSFYKNDEFSDNTLYHVYYGGYSFAGVYEYIKIYFINAAGKEDFEKAFMSSFKINRQFCVADFAKMLVIVKNTRIQIDYKKQKFTFFVPIDIRTGKPPKYRGFSGSKMPGP